MVLKCAACGGNMEITGGVPENVKIKCPHCGEYVRISKPTRIELPTGSNLPRFVPDGEQYQQKMGTRHPDLHVRRPPVKPIASPPVVPSLTPPRVPSCRSKKKANGDGDWVIYGLLAVVVMGFGIYFWHKSSVHHDESSLSSDASTQSEESDRLTADAEMKKRQEARRRKDEAEREKRRLERIKREAEREQKRQEMVRKTELERQCRELMAKSERGYNGADTVFASDLPVGQRPFDFSEDCFFTVADEGYIGSRSLYRLEVAEHRLKSVQRISQRAGAEDLATGEFMRLITNKVVLAKMESGPVLICGDTKMSKLIDIPVSSGSYAPLPLFLGSTLPVLNALHASFPSVKYRVTLKAKDGRGDLKLGIVEKEIDLQSIRSKVREQLTDRKLKASGSGIKPPAMRKFKRTVVFYDGEKIVREMTGLIKVPRTFNFFGTARNHDNKAHVSDIIQKAREKWEALRMEAERQDKKEMEVEIANQRKMDEYRRKTNEAVRAARPTEEEVDEELGRYRLLIERSRTKIRKVR